MNTVVAFELRTLAEGLRHHAQSNTPLHPKDCERYANSIDAYVSMAGLPMPPGRERGLTPPAIPVRLVGWR